MDQNKTMDEIENDERNKRKKKKKKQTPATTTSTPKRLWSYITLACTKIVS